MSRVTHADFDLLNPCYSKPQNFWEYRVVLTDYHVVTQKNNSRLLPDIFEYSKQFSGHFRGKSGSFSLIFQKSLVA